MTRTLLLLTALLVGCAGHPSGEEAAAEPFPDPPAPETIVTSVNDVMVRAEIEGKLAMLVLGANWCHDSTHFVEMIESPELRELLEQRYVVALFNTGYMDHVKDYLQPLGVPAIYGTPTVLIVDPVTGDVRNLDQHYYWRNASQLTEEDARRYFSRYLMAPAPPVPMSPRLAEALAQIDSFEAAQGQRIYAAYTALGELMREGDGGDLPEGFVEKWKNLGRMRSQITGDLEALRQSAREQDAAGAAAIELDFPEYALFID